ncbi:MAG: UPF0175 family protein [Campylobacterota bacterium]|nr:UPF0175 family protein [Campylobacterota bacterium]
MPSVSIHDLKNNSTNMTQQLEEGNAVFVTKHGKPIGITLPLDEAVVSQSIKELFYFDLYKKDEISFGKLAEFLGIRKDKLRKMFAASDMPVINYKPAEVEDELKILDTMQTI